jgi:UDP-N-acetylglucosamine 2-epimerase (non-hydrolysing)
MKIKLSIVFGTRPEFIKLVPVINKFKNDHLFDVNVCFTGQHKEMVFPLFEIFEINPDQNFELMEPNQTLGSFSAKLMISLEEYFDIYKPDALFIQGDTTTVLISSLLAFYKKIKVFHVEAGLRTFDKFSPFPEELNRICTTKIADYHFAPTKDAYNNLIDDKILEKNICITGNTSIDTLLLIKQKLLGGKLKAKLDSHISFLINKYKGQIILITAHRRENFGKPLENICEAISILSKKYPEKGFLYPVHLNPNVQSIVKAHLLGHDNIHLIDPLNYLDFIYLMLNSEVIMTDSGGVQEEAPGLSKPVLVLRESTERMEGVHAGVLTLVGTNTDKIIYNFTKVISEISKEPKKINNPFGDGTAADKIYEFTLKTISLNENHCN